MAQDEQKPKNGFGHKTYHFLNKHARVLGVVLAALAIVIPVVLYWPSDKPSPQPTPQVTIHQEATGKGITQTTGPVIVYNRDPNDAKTIQELSKQIGVSEQVVNSFFKQIQRDNIPREKWDESFNKIVEDYRKLQKEMAAFQADDPETKRLIDQAKNLADQARFDEAYDKLEQARQRELDATKLLKDRLREKTIKAAEVTALQARLLAANGGHLRAAKRFEEAAAMISDYLGEAADDYLLLAAEEYMDHGRIVGDYSSLQKSITINRTILVKTSRGQQPERWAAAQNSLGNALLELGSRESDPALLRQAVEAYSSALEVFTRQGMSMGCALIQNNLGGALRELGSREPDAALLRQAMEACHKALEVCTRQVSPMGWAFMQSNLGYVLQTLGSRESDPALLRQAVEACHKALDVFTRQSSPMAWAGTQNNLGNALLTLGAHESDPALLGQAVDAYRSALEVYTRQAAPMPWAEVQNNLGSALQELGSRESDPALLSQAVDAFRGTLDVYTRQAAPMTWARIQYNMGNAMLELGSRESDPALLGQAVEAFRRALEVITRQASPMEWAAIQNNRGLALNELGGRESDPARLRQAVEAFRSALEVITRQASPMKWATSQNNLGRALMTLGIQKSDPQHLEAAAVAFMSAAGLWGDQEKQPHADIDIINLATTLDELIKLIVSSNRFDQQLPVTIATLTRIERRDSKQAWSAFNEIVGNIMFSMGNNLADSGWLKQSLAAFEKALTVKTSDKYPKQYANIKNMAGTASLVLWTIDHDVSHLTDAIKAYKDALSAVGPSANPQFIDLVTQNLHKAERALNGASKGNQTSSLQRIKSATIPIGQHGALAHAQGRADPGQRAQRARVHQFVDLGLAHGQDALHAPAVDEPLGAAQMGDRSHAHLPNQPGRPARRPGAGWGLASRPVWAPGSCMNK